MVSLSDGALVAVADPVGAAAEPTAAAEPAAAEPAEPVCLTGGDADPELDDPDSFWVHAVKLNTIESITNRRIAALVSCPR